MKLPKTRSTGTWAIAGAFGLFMAPLMASCTAIGFHFQRLSGQVSSKSAPQDVAKRDVVPGDYYASLEGSFTTTARDRFPVPGEHLEVIAKGARLLSVGGAPELLVYCEGDACSPFTAEPTTVRVRGRVCDEHEPLACVYPDPLKTYVRARETSRRPPSKETRVFIVGASPSDDVWQARTGFGIAGLELVLLFGLVGLVRWQRSRPPRFHTERSWIDRESALDVERLLTILGALPGFRLLDRGPDFIAFRHGLTDGRARIVGIRQPEQVPVRGFLRWEIAPYQPVRLYARLEEDSYGFLPPQLEGICRAAFERTLALCGAPRV